VSSQPCAQRGNRSFITLSSACGAGPRRFHSRRSGHDPGRCGCLPGGGGRSPIGAAAPAL